MLKESRNVRLADAIHRVLRNSRIALFLHRKSNHVLTMLHVRTKVLPHVMKNINEFNIPLGNCNDYEILYFGVNLILMFDYRLAFDIEVKNSDDATQVLIISRKDIPRSKGLKLNCTMTEVD
jgi:hypothetical protein